MEPGLMETKMQERIEWSVSMVKEAAKKEGIDFDKDLFLVSIEVAKTLLVRSEIAYSGRKA